MHRFLGPSPSPSQVTNEVEAVDITQVNRILCFINALIMRADHKCISGLQATVKMMSGPSGTVAAGLVLLRETDKVAGGTATGKGRSNEDA